jgi:hypothetical protein
VESKPKSIERLEQYATDIRALVKIEATERGYRLMVASKSDPSLEEMLVSYVEENLGLSLEDDDLVTPSPEWRRLGIIVGYREVSD